MSNKVRKGFFVPFPHHQINKKRGTHALWREKCHLLLVVSLCSRVMRLIVVDDELRKVGGALHDDDTLLLRYFRENNTPKESWNCIVTGGGASAHQVIRKERSK
jgi:hypothetical protein